MMWIEIDWPNACVTVNTQMAIECLIENPSSVQNLLPQAIQIQIFLFFYRVL